MGYANQTSGSSGSTSASSAANTVAPGRIPATAHLTPRQGTPRATASTVNPAATPPSAEAAHAAEKAEAGDPFGVHLMGDKVHQDLAQACDGKHGDGCFLSPVDETRIIRDIDGNLVNARENWAAALANEITNLKVVGHEGWNIIWKAAAMLAMAGVGAGVGAGLAFIAEAATSITAVKAAAALVNREEQIRGLFALAGGVLEGKAAAKVNADANQHEDASYLQTQLEKPGLWYNALRKTYPKQLDHYGLVLLRGMTDPGNFTVAAFTATIKQALAQWTAQVHQVGDVAAGLVETVTWVFPRGGGQPRLARVLAWLPPGEGGRNNNLVPRAFKTWVVPELVPLALAAQLEKKVVCAGMTTLGDLDGAPTDDATSIWDRGTIGDDIVEPTEPTVAFSHEDGPRVP